MKIFLKVLRGGSFYHKKSNTCHTVRNRSMWVFDRYGIRVVMGIKNEKQ